MKTISVIIPVYNEEANIPLIYAAVLEAWKGLPNYNLELLFVDDGSQDESAQAIEHLLLGEQQSPRHSGRLIELSRNFGKEMATTAGIHEATGDAVIMLDADLQHPPACIPQFVEVWEQGAEVVVGVRSRNSGEGFIKRWGSIIFYKIMGAISDTEFVPGETDFRLVDRKVVEAYKSFPEHERMTRSLINWLGFRRGRVVFEAAARQNGTPGYSTLKLVHLAVNSFLSNTLLPLRFAGYLGVAITLFSGLLGVLVIVTKYLIPTVFGSSITGTAQLAILLLFLIGIVLAMLGIIGLYVGSIHTEVSNRPLYVIRRQSEKTQDKS